jgi:sugar lactone lactonase YvrE
MKKPVVRVLISVAAAVALLLVWVKVRYGAPVRPFPDTTTAPLLSSSDVEIVATLDEAPGNIAVSHDGRIFFNFHPEGRPSMKVVEWVRGSAVPFPEEEFPLFDSVFSLRIDRQGRLWTVDHGFHGLRQPRLLAFDIESREVVHRWDIPREIAGIGSYVQDFQVSPDGRQVFLADIGVLAKKPAIIVYDVETNAARRVLERHPSLTDQPFVIDARGRRMILLGGLYAMHPALDSIGLDAEGEWLYYGAMSHPRMYRVRTEDLVDSTLEDAELAARIEDFGPKPQSDGISLDLKGNVYITDVEHGAMALLRQDGSLQTLLRDDRFRWLDGLSFGPDGWLYMTDSALPEIMLKSRTHIRRHAPYFIWRFRPGHEGIPGR